MLTNEFVTIFTFDDEKDDYVKKGTFRAWVRRMRRIRNMKKGTYFCDNFDVRIERDAVDEVNVGDLIYFGDMREEEFSLSQCRKIAVVSCNSFGRIPHWHLEAEYEYR